MTWLSAARVLVVGASSGIGMAVASTALNSGALVAVAARRRDRLDDFVGGVGGAEGAGGSSGGRGARAFTCDVADEAAFGAAVGEVVDWLGGLDLVVHAAAETPLGALRETGADEWQRVLAINLVGAAVVSRLTIPLLREGREGTLVLMTSHSVDEPWPGLVPYAAAKAGVRALARGLRVEEPGVRVVLVTVGPTATGFADGWGPSAGPWMDWWAAEGYLRHRVQSPGEVAAAVLAAASGGPDEVSVIGDSER